MKNRVLITGGCGFIGSNLIPILEKNNYDVLVLDNLSIGKEDYIKSTNAKLLKGDIRNRNDVLNAVSGCSTVIHLAASGSVIDSISSPENNFDINVNGLFNVLNQSRYASVKSFIFASTGGALIGDAKPPVSEKSLPSPISPYGSSKLTGEAYCSSFAKSYGMNITSLRFANIIGPNSSHKKGAVTTFMKAIKEEKTIRIYGDGNATRDFLFVKDLCFGIINALKANLRGYNVFHLASGKEITINELASTICDIANKPNFPIEYLNKRQGEVEKNFADISLAKKLINFKANTNFYEAIKQTWEIFKE